jgi:hypothetical protein
MKKFTYIVIFFVLLFFFTPISLLNSMFSLNSTQCELLGLHERLERFFDQLCAINPSLANDSKKQPAGSSSQPLDIPENYIIGQGDVLEVFVWRNEQLSRQVTVRPDGKISLPLLQDIQAEGLTVLQLKNEITKRFSEYLTHPNVTLIVIQITSYKVSVLGRVVRPGVYPITGKTTLVEAIARKNHSNYPRSRKRKKVNNQL